MEEEGEDRATDLRPAAIHLGGAVVHKGLSSSHTHHQRVLHAFSGSKAGCDSSVAYASASI